MVWECTTGEQESTPKERERALGSARTKAERESRTCSLRVQWPCSIELQWVLVLRELKFFSEGLKIRRDKDITIKNIKYT